MMEEKIYPLYIVNIAKKEYEYIECASAEERDAVIYIADVMSGLFDIYDYTVKYVEPEFEEIE